MKTIVIPFIRQPMPLDTLILIISGSCITIYILNLIFWRLLKHVLNMAIGSCLTLTLIGIYIYSQIDDSNDLSKAKTREILQGYQCYDLFDDLIWKNTVNQSSNEIPNKLTIFSESFLLSDAVESLIEHIMRDFVLSWYQKAFKDDVFPAHVDHVIREATVELGNRTKNVQWTDVLVRKITPLVTEHLSKFINAVEVVRERSTGRKLVESKELDMAIAEKYGKLHEAIVISDTGYEDTNRLNWLKKKIDKILPFLVNKNDIRSSLVSNLTRDILACSIFEPIISMICSPDFINQKFTDAGQKILRDRQRVAQLREALDIHSGSISMSQTRKRAVSGVQPNLRLSPNADQAAFEKFIRGIKKCQSLPDARQIRFYISVQIQRAAKNGTNPLYENRLKEAKHVIDDQLATLSSRKELFGSTGETNGKDDPRYQYSLDDILKDSMCSSFFMEFMDQKHKTILVQFLLTVNILREPLGNDYDEDTGTSTDPLGGLEVAGQKKDKQQNHQNDILQIDHQYFNEMNEIGYSNEAFMAVNGYCSKQNADYSEYQKALAAILKTQSHVYRTIEQQDVKKFKESDLFIKYLASSPFIQLEVLNSSIDGLQLDHVDSTEEEVEGSMADLSMSRNALTDSSLTRNAVTRNDLNDSILNRNTATREPLSESNTTRSELEGLNFTKNDLDDSNSSKNDLDDSINDFTASPRFEHQKDEKNLVEVEKALNDIMKPDKEETTMNEKNPGILKRLRLFDEDDDIDSDESSQMLDYETKTTDFQPNIDDLQIRMANPGDLTLTEAIKVLSIDISRLYDQQAVVDKLITKAELTNNTTELRILQKSHTSLQREIQLKELQRQQFYVQESENSLFGRSETRIDSYITSMDSNGPFTLYIIEVRRFDGDGKVTAGWIVGRRYNQFYQLHQHLKHQFPNIKTLAFPKKRVALKFQPKTFVDARRQALERYLNELLKDQEVCRSKALRLFLSSDNFSVNHVYNESSTGFDSDDSSTNLSTSSSSRPGTSSRPGSSLARPGLSSKSGGLSKSSSRPRSSSMEIIPILDSEADDNEALKPFVQPLCDLFIQVLGFGTKENWMKGRAVVIILQQLLGGRIEKKVREVITSMTSESKIVEFVHMIQDSIWPNGQRRNGPKYERTTEEKATTKRQAEITVVELFDSIGVVVGRSSARYAAKNVFSVTQNETLNYQLIFNILELVMDEMFPEVGR